MTNDDRAQCRWFTDGPSGRCPNPRAFPGVPEIPELCVRHLADLEPWIASRALARRSAADGWIDWARRQAAETEAWRRAIGAAPVMTR